ncbi:MAG TPA: DUF3159 domain-containing protein [Pseudonocardiaceae bacterium]|jgi:hypothetical protein|nr:DUF3159 domain-containing protein [Pseudonocardiaceae bacterium]
MSQSGPRSAESVGSTADVDTDSNIESDSAAPAGSLSAAPAVEPPLGESTAGESAEQPDGAETDSARTAADTAADDAAAADSADADSTDDEAMPTLLEQMGGLSGLIYSSVPVLVFVGVYLPTRSLSVSIWASVASAVLILIWRLVRREKIQPAISGLLGVAVAAFIAYRTGSARGYFAFGIWTSLVYGGVFAISMIIRWPLAGVVWSALNSKGMAWRADPKCRRYYDVATLVWVLVFGVRFVAQEWLYNLNQVGWLAAARLGLGWPLTAIGALVTIWAVRKADQRQKELTPTPA